MSNETADQPAFDCRPSPLNSYIGSRIRSRRDFLGISQQSLADSLLVSPQQVQNYEWGMSRVGYWRLFEISCLLDVPISFFFSQTSKGDAVRPSLSATSQKTDIAQAKDPFSNWVDEDLTKNETQNLVRNYYGIAEASIRKQLLVLIATLAYAEDRL